MRRPTAVTDPTELHMSNIARRSLSANLSLSAKSSTVSCGLTSRPPLAVLLKFVLAPRCPLSHMDTAPGDAGNLLASSRTDIPVSSRQARSTAPRSTAALSSIPRP